MRTPSLALFVVLALSGSLAAAAEDGHIAQLRTVTGDVHVLRHGEVLQAQPGLALLREDTLESAANGSAGLSFIDGTTVAIGPSSHVDLRRYTFEPDDSKFGFEMFLKKGQAIYASGKIGKAAPETVHISTPHATLGVRGTRFIVEAD